MHTKDLRKKIILPMVTIKIDFKPLLDRPCFDCDMIQIFRICWIKNKNMWDSKNYVLHMPSETLSHHARELGEMGIVALDGLIKLWNLMRVLVRFGFGP